MSKSEFKQKAQEWQEEINTIDSEGLSYWIDEYSGGIINDYPELKPLIKAHNLATENIKNFLRDIVEKYNLTTESGEI